MADSEAFNFVCDALERASALDRLAARGTVRIALREAGLESGNVSPEQLQVAVERVLPAELLSRGIGDGGALCGDLCAKLAAAGIAPVKDTPERVFRRLGGGR